MDSKTQDLPRGAYTVEEFCFTHSLSKATYYRLPPEDRPREIAIGRAKRITVEAAADWRRDMEEKTARRQSQAQEGCADAA